jgi:hypothetical protein
MLSHFIVLVLFSSHTLAQVELSPDVVKIVEALSVSEGNTVLLEDMRKAKGPKDKDCPEEMQNKLPQLVILDQLEDKPQWSFSVQSTLTGPKGKIQKTFLTADKAPEIKSLLDSAINQSFDSYKDRMKYVGNSCKDFDQNQKISLASQLAGRLSRIYDDKRTVDINGGP